MGVIKVNYAALETAVSDMQRARGELEGRLTGLKTDTDALVAEWEGEERQTYLMHRAEVDKAWQQLTAILADVANRVTQHSANTQQNDLLQARRWQA